MRIMQSHREIYARELEDGPVAHRVEFLARSMARPLQFPNSPFGLKQWKLAASRALTLAKTGPQEFHNVRSGTIPSRI
jgi:hypothetical protein